MKHLIKNSLGFSLVSSMVASAVVGISILGFAQFMGAQHKAMQAVNQKFESLRVQQALVRTMADPKTCTCLIDDQRFDLDEAPSLASTGKTVQGLPRILGGCTEGAAGSSTNVLASLNTFIDDDLTNGLYVTGIQIENIQADGPPSPSTQEYTGNLKIYYGLPNPAIDGATQLVGNLKPSSAVIKFTADRSTNRAIGCTGADLTEFFQQTITETNDTIETVRVAGVETIRDRVVQVGNTEVENIERVGNDRVVSIAGRLETKTQEFTNELERISRITIERTQNTTRDMINEAQSERTRIIAEAQAERERIVNSVDEGSLSGMPRIVRVTPLGSGVVNVTVETTPVNGAYAAEVRLSHNDGRSGQNSSPCINRCTIPVNAGSLMGETLRVSAVAVGRAGQKSGRVTGGTVRVN